jgi:hypothetical protein
MEDSQSNRIANIETEIGWLLKQERSVNATVEAKSTAPSVRVQAQMELQRLQQKIRALSDEVRRLESEP